MEYYYRLCVVTFIAEGRFTPSAKRAQSLSGSGVTRIVCAESAEPSSDILWGELVHHRLVDQHSVSAPPPLRQGNPRVV